MVDVNTDPTQAALIIRGAPGKLAGLTLGSLAFIVVGVLMLTVPPPLGRSPVLAGVGGVLSLLLGLAGLGTVAQAAPRPLLLLYPDRLVDVRLRLTLPCAEIRDVALIPRTRGFLVRWLNPQWLLLTVHDPARYAALERLSRCSGLSDADLTLDLNLASAADYERAWLFIGAQLLPAALGTPGLAGT